MGGWTSNSQANNLDSLDCSDIPLHKSQIYSDSSPRTAQFDSVSHWLCSLMGAHFVLKMSILRCRCAIIFSIIYTFFTLLCHWGIVGGSGFNHDRVIIFLAINNRTCNRDSFLFSHLPWGSSNNIKFWSQMSIFNIDNYFWIPSQ